MDQLQYLVINTFCESNGDDLAFSALPDAPVTPVRLPASVRFRLWVRATVLPWRGAVGRRGSSESGEALPVEGTATTV